MTAEIDSFLIVKAGLLDGIPNYVLLVLVASVILLATFAYFNMGRKPKSIEVRQAPGSRVALAISDRFAPSDRFSGFVHEESGASIVLMELPFTAFDQLKNLENAAETFAAQGVTNIASQTLAQRSGDYVYLRGQQNTMLVDYAKHILIFRENNATGMVTANIPRVALTSGLLTGGEIEGILSSARIRKGATDPKKLFSLDYLGPFEEDLSLLGTTKGYRLQETATSEGKSLKPLFLVAPSLAQAPIPDLQRFAERTFNSIDQVRDKAIEATRSLEIAGLNAIEIHGGGVDDNSREPTFVYQMIVEARHGGYFRLVGMAPTTAKAQLLPEYKKIAESFKPA